MKKIQRTDFLNKFHIWTVRSLMGLTLGGCVVLGFQVYNYVKYVRPARMEEKRRIRSEEIVLEQNEKEVELLRRQREAENLMKY